MLCVTGRGVCADVAVCCQARIDMCVFDEDGDGYLKHTELEAYIGQLIPRWVLRPPKHTG